MTHSHGDTDPIALPSLVDLAAERVGGAALAANDEFFGPKEALLKPGRGISIPGKYTEQGKWVDGWETRRKRESGHDWCIVRLGLPGTVQLLNIDTNHFLGNHPACASVEACTAAGGDELEGLPWKELLARSPLRPGSMNLFPVTCRDPVTHLRLNIFPDGGVARFRAYGKVVPMAQTSSGNELVDLVALANGGTPVTASDSFFSSLDNLILPGPSLDMGDGWETRRRRQPGDDWAVLKTGHRGRVIRLEIATEHFKGNAPAACSVEVSRHQDRSIDILSVSRLEWQEILPRTPLRPDSRHVFEEELTPAGGVNYVRLRIYPDGGISRFRVWGHWEDE